MFGSARASPVSRAAKQSGQKGPVRVQPNGLKKTTKAAVVDLFDTPNNVLRQVVPPPPKTIAEQTPGRDDGS